MIWDISLTIFIQTQFCYKVAITLHIIVPCQFVNFPMFWGLWATVPLQQSTHNTENYLHHKKEKKNNSHLVHIVPRFGWRFYIRYTPLLCSSISLSKGHFPFLIQVTLIPNQKERYVLITLYTKDLISVAIRYNLIACYIITIMIIS